MLTNDTVCNQYIKNVPQIISVKQISLEDRFQVGMDMLAGIGRCTQAASWLCILLFLAVCFLAASVRVSALPTMLAVDLCITTHPGCLHAFIALSVVLGAVHGTVLF